MIISKVQQYLIAILLVVIASNAIYSVFLYNSRKNAFKDRDDARSQTQQAVNETNEVRAQNVTIQKALDQTRAELEAARAAIETREAELDRINKAKEASNAKIERALDANRDWSSQPIPDGVRDALNKTL